MKKTFLLWAALGCAALRPAVAQYPVYFERPEVRGAMFVGQELAAWRGLWQQAGTLVFNYQWQAANNQYGSGLTNLLDADGLPATSTSFTVSPAYQGRFLRLRVTAINPAIWWQPATTADSFFRRVVAAPSDFDGDGRSDLWFYYETDGLWRVAFSNHVSASTVFGGPGFDAAPADYDGDGLADPAIYSAADGLWSALLSRRGYDAVSLLGAARGGTAVPADYDGDGLADPAVYEPDSGRWTAQLSSRDYVPVSKDCGGPDYLPVPADYDGDGLTDPAVYQPDPGIWTALLSTRNYNAEMVVGGGPEFWPLPGDYDGDSRADLSVYWPAGNRWWMKSSRSGAISTLTFGTSTGQGVPTQGFFDQDALCDPVTIHLANDFVVWGVNGSRIGYRGQSFEIATRRWRVSW